MPDNDVFPALRWPADPGAYARMLDDPAIAGVLDDVGIVCRSSLWLPGDFDPRALHRRDGWALRRYRGEHRTRPGAYTVDDLARIEIVTASIDRQRHLRSLRRPFNPGPIFLGGQLTNVKFYGVQAEPTLGTITLSIEPSVSVPTIPTFDELLHPRQTTPPTTPIPIESEGDTNA